MKFHQKKFMHMGSVVCLFGVCTVALSQHFEVQCGPSFVSLVFVWLLCHSILGFKPLLWLPAICRPAVKIVGPVNHQDAGSCLDVVQNEEEVKVFGQQPDESEGQKMMPRHR
jgi:hypothetical protein